MAKRETKSIKVAIGLAKKLRSKCHKAIRKLPYGKRTYANFERCLRSGRVQG